MEEKSRTYKVIRNSSVSMICQMIFLILSFVCRTIFSRILGTEYLGLNGLFSNILTILSFAELGVGSALVYRMYKPLAEGDQNKVLLYVKLYKRIYAVIFFIIAAVGLSIIPFLHFIVQAPNVPENLYLLYVLFLMQTLVSYVYVYKKSILIADQRNYVVDICTQIFNIIMNIAQIIILILTHNYILYCIINIVCNLLNNIVCSKLADKHYEYLKNAANGELSKEEISGLYKDLKGLMLTKIASVAFSGTDNIFISSFIGIQYVGILSNYTLILNTINGIIGKVFDSITSSIGNLVVNREKEKTETVLRRIFFLNASMYGYVCLGMALLLRFFVKEIWLTNEYDLTQGIVTIVILELLLRGMHYPVYITRNALGSFSEYKVVFTAMAFLNIGLDFILVKPLGIIGLYMATIICRSVTYVIDIYVVYKEQLGKSILNHFSMLLKWGFFLIANYFVSGYAITLIHASSIFAFVLQIIIITGIYFISFVMVFFRSEEFMYFYALVNRIVRKRK